MTKNDEEVVVTEQIEVESSIHLSKKDLFNCKDDLLNNDAIEDFLGYESSQSIPKLSDHQKENMKGSITLEEMTRYLKKLRNVIQAAQEVT